MNQLKLFYFGYIMRRSNSLQKTAMLGKVEGRRKEEENDQRKDGWTQLQWTTSAPLEDVKDSVRDRSSSWEEK